MFIVETGRLEEAIGIMQKVSLWGMCVQLRLVLCGRGRPMCPPGGNGYRFLSVSGKFGLPTGGASRWPHPTVPWAVWVASSSLYAYAQTRVPQPLFIGTALTKRLPVRQGFRIAKFKPSATTVKPRSSRNGAT